MSNGCVEDHIFHGLVYGKKFFLSSLYLREDRQRRFGRGY